MAGPHDNPPPQGPPGYYLGHRLGQGAFGDVWSATAPGGVQVAVKIIHRTRNPAKAERELEALNLLVDLQHQYLLGLQAFFPLEDRLLIVLERAHGSLRHRLKQCRQEGQAGVPTDELLRYFHEAAEALDYLHQNGIQHRDIKPDNLLLLGRHVKVADFGLARVLEGQGVVPASIVGTPPYMAPEVWQGTVSVHSDQYSLAVTWAELRFGWHPFAADGPGQQIPANLQRDPDLKSFAPAERDVLLRALARKPERRYSSCTVFAKALEEALAVTTEPAPSRPPDSHEPPTEEMPPPTLEVSWRDHRAALKWVGTLYRRPARFRDAVRGCTPRKRLLAALWIVAHCFPYLVLLGALGRGLLFGFLSLPTASPQSTVGDALAFHARHAAAGGTVGVLLAGLVGVLVRLVGKPGGALAVALASGLSLSLALGITAGTLEGVVAGGAAFGLALGLAGGLTGSITRGIADEMPLAKVEGITVVVAGETRPPRVVLPLTVLLGIAAVLMFALALRIQDPNLGIAALQGSNPGITPGIAFGLGAGLAIALVLPRAYYLAIHPFFLWPRSRGHWYPYHPVAWDDLCLVPFPGLDRLLAAYAEQDVRVGRVEIERLLRQTTPQKTAAQRALVRLLAREAARERNLTRLEETVAGLPTGKNGYLKQTARLREMVTAISRLQMRLDSAEHPSLREPMAELLCKEIESFHQEVGTFREPLASEFQRAAAQWLVVARRQRYNGSPPE